MNPRHRFFTVLAMLIAGLCLIRVLSVAAATKYNEDVEEVYTHEEGSAEEGDFSEQRTSSDTSRAEIRFTRPEDAQDSIAQEGGYDLVPGVERVQNREIASTSSNLEVPHRQAKPLVEKVESEDLIVPQKQSRTVATETITPFSTQVSSGLKNDPSPNIVPPVPSQSMPTGVQEVSLIVSDYGFFPNRIFVTKDLPVKIFLSTPSKTTLCFMVDEWGVRKGVTPGKVEEISFVPEKLGNVRFYCPVKSIEGMITVREPFEAEPQRQIASSVLEPEPIEAIETPKHNEPKNAPQLRALIDNEGEDLPKETPQEN